LPRSELPSGYQAADAGGNPATTTILLGTHNDAPIPGPSERRVQRRQLGSIPQASLSAVADRIGHQPQPPIIGVRHMTTSASVIDLSTLPTYDQLEVHLDKQHRVCWCYMQSTGRPCFSDAMLDDLNNWCSYLRRQGGALDVRYHVSASAMPGTYSLGGDLDLFYRHIQHRDRDGLYRYGRKCIEALYANIVSFGQPITTISLVQGDALGGGFETALSSDVLIAEKGTQMGFPEILFNLFPGMGAYSLLSRKLGAKQAERMILSGELYTAETLYEMGLVDVLAEPGEGELAVYAHIRREDRARNGFAALRRARDSVDPITFDELDRIVQIWVDAALNIDSRDLRMMQRLVSRQSQLGRRAA
jgi:DSF synthase